MKKYLEQRIEDLELEIKLLKANNELRSSDYMYNSSINLMSEPDLETAFASPFDKSEIKKNPLNTLDFETPLKLDPLYFPDVKLKSTPQSDCDFPEYPDIVGSWDGDKNVEDIISEENNESITSWGFVSDFDKMDKDFLEWVKSHEARNAYEISKNITNNGKKPSYRPFKVK